MKAALLIVLIASAFAATTTQQQIMSLLQTGTKASDAIDTVFDLLKDLKQSNFDTQFAADRKNETDELIGAATISKFTEVKNLNQKLMTTSQENRVRFEQELAATKNYIAWNELRQDEINRKIEVLLDNQCFSNQLFVRSIKHNQEALEVVRMLKQDVAGYVINGESFELNQMPKQEVQSMADKLKMYSNIFSQNEINSFLQLANDEETEVEGEEQVTGGRNGTVAERVLSILEDLENSLAESLGNLEANEIAASWELAGWVASSQAELSWLASDLERKHVYADRLATVRYKSKLLLLNAPNPRSSYRNHKTPSTRLLLI